MSKDSTPNTSGAANEAPWLTEPSDYQWEHAGFPCELWRNGFGVWCGYVAVPPGHPWHGKHYDDINASVHGGLTYADDGDHESTWVVGFDCGHFGDFSPELARYGGEYRTLEYAKAETERLAEQARGAK